MDIKSALFYAEIVVGFFLFIFVAYFLLKALGVILMVVLAGIGFVAKVIFKVLYILFMMALTVCGAGYAMYTGLLFLNHEPIHILWTLSGVFVMLLGMNGLLKFIKNGFRFPSEIPLTNSYPNPRNEIISHDWDNDDRREREEQEKYWKDKKQESLDEDRYKAEAAERREAYYAQKEQEREDYTRDKEKGDAINKQYWDDWQERQDERAKWSQQDE